MSKNETQNENNICSYCEQEKDDVKARRIFIKKEIICKECFQQKVKALQKYNLIRFLCCLIPLIIGLILDFLEVFDGLEFGAGILICGTLAGFIVQFLLPKFIRSIDKTDFMNKYLDDAMLFHAMESSSRGLPTSEGASVMYIAGKGLVIFFKCVMAFIFFAIFLIFSLIKFNYYTVVRKFGEKLNTFWRIVVVLLSIVLLWLIILLLVNLIYFITF